VKALKNAFEIRERIIILGIINEEQLSRNICKFRDILLTNDMKNVIPNVFIHLG
jgi:hypothetical protein